MLVEVKDVVVEDTVVVVVCTPRERKKGRMRQEVVILAVRRSKALTLQNVFEIFATTSENDGQVEMGVWYRE
jgi:hypothetical protein